MKLKDRTNQRSRTEAKRKAKKQKKPKGKKGRKKGGRHSPGTKVLALYMYPLYKAKIFCLPAKKLLALKAGKREIPFPFKSL
jgi:hypothetical protein